MTALEEVALALPEARAAISEGRSYRVAKRVVDVVLSALLLVVTAPLVTLMALAIWLETPGSPILCQTRVGRGGRHFRLVKLRGMHADARERWPHLFDYRLGPAELESFRFHAPHDPRVTRVGRLARRTSIDELPNLWNVLRGEMSLVGPRPEIPAMLPYYGEAADVVLSVKPGVTSLAKARGRDSLTFTETLALDVRYVSERSLALDLKLIALTAAAVFRASRVEAG